MATYLTNCKYSLLIYQKCFQLGYLIPSLSLRTVSESQHPFFSICLKSGEFIMFCSNTVTGLLWWHAQEHTIFLSAGEEILCDTMHLM